MTDAPELARPIQAESLDGLEHEVGILVRRIRRVLAERATGVDPQLSTPSFLMLTYLAETGPQRSADIVEHFDIDKGAISRQVAQLVELGLVTRSPDPEDGRAQLIEVSERGRARLESMSERRRALLVQRLADWDDADLSTFVALLSRYNASLSRLSELAEPGGSLSDTLVGGR
ncbi:hypothetical protein GCM10011519_14470 [Marmoricola endophyticus]|uniref:HTH marR-type domain-containing protein n=1 Tax=Marmoricola endophyticus TaxID=2040280 RepID=A0A917BG67_9ACTN|nr:MarR family transcriptional regulator [Marmoricola endophyticus]GGF41768.1 hypothetical protein GCM10011519_14470 [Marmoricola endophyticus]